MPNWKKVVVSGSDAVLNNITASSGISSSGLLYASLSYDNTPVANGIVTYDVATGQFYYTGSDGLYDNLGNHTASANLNMNNFNIYSASRITVHVDSQYEAKGYFFKQQYGSELSAITLENYNTVEVGGFNNSAVRIARHYDLPVAYFSSNTSYVTSSFTASGELLVIGGLTASSTISASGDLIANNGLFSGNLTVQGDIIAENYIVSSSVTYMTQSFSSGSTIFGDTLNDTHLFTGSVDITGSLIVNGMTYPITDGTSGQVLTTDGSGNLTFTNTTTAITASAISASYIDLDPLELGNEPAWKEGRIFYSAENGALSVYNSEADITLQVGQEFWKKAKNGLPSTTILNGTPVKISGSNGSNPVIYPAVAEDYTVGDHYFENHVIGIATHDISGNAIGFVTEKGLVNNVDTSMFTSGDTLYLQSSSAGLRNTPPPYPYDIVQVGTVIRSHATEGSIEVNTREPIHFGIISGLSGSASGPGDLWVYQNNQAWTPTKSLTGSYDITGSLTTTVSVSTDTLNAKGAHITKAITLGVIGVSTIAFEQTAYSITTDSITSIEQSTAGNIIYEYTLTDSTNGYARTGQILITANSSNMEFTEVSTADIGSDPLPPTLSVSLSGGNVILRIQNGSGYKFKALKKTF